MTLTDFAVKKLVAKEKSYRVSDAKGLALLVHVNGSKYWQYRYRFAGKGKLLALGVYPETTLAEARERRDEARKQLVNDIDPGAVRKIRKIAKFTTAINSFQAVGEEWYCLQKSVWSESHKVRTWRLLEKNLFPWLGNRPIADIAALELLAALRRIESRGAKDTAKRARQTAGQVFRFAIATGRATHDPSQDLRGALARSTKTHRAAITEPKEVGPFLLTLDGYQGSVIVRAALQLAPLTFVRPGELRKAHWSEFDLDAAEWRISPDRMKMRQPHIVPLSRQALVILHDLYRLTGPDGYLFPHPRTNTRPMSDNAVLAAMRRMGIGKEEMCGHGFRAMARTILDEVLNYRVDWIEHQLAHAVRDVNGRAYNRTAHLESRRKMMQGWADYLDTLRSEASGSNVVPIQPPRMPISQRPKCIGRTGNGGTHEQT
jgi:integrase